MSSSQFHALKPHDYIRQVVEEDTGIILQPEKDYLIHNRLGPILQKYELRDLQELVRHLHGNKFKGLREDVAQAFATGETFFFRDRFPFDACEEFILPDLIQKRGKRKALTVWSVGCSTGQEPYSVAMLLQDKFPQLEAWNVRIIAIDLSEAFLDRARLGQYSTFEINRGLPSRYKREYFTGIESDTWELKAATRRRVEFEQFNLIAPWPVLANPDFIFLRNVLIYFSEETKRNILKKVERILAPGGYLLLGSSENLLHQESSLEQVTFGRTICYRQRG